MRGNQNDFFDFDMNTNIFEKLEQDKINNNDTSNKDQKFLI